MARPSPVPFPTSLVVKNGSKTRGRMCGRYAEAGVGDRQKHVLARRHIAELGDIVLAEPRVGGLDGDVAAVGHGVAGVDDEIDDRVVDMARIGKGRPKARREYRFDFHRFADRAGQHVGHVCDRFVEIELVRRERLLTCEGEQFLRKPGRPPRAVGRGLQWPGEFG